MKREKFTTVTTRIDQDGTLIASNCGDIEFLNAGTIVVTVSGRPVNPGQVYRIPCNYGELNATNYTIILNGNPDVYITKKQYYEN